MKGQEMRRLERELQSDLHDAPDAVLNRVREQVKQFLLEDATRLAGKRVKHEDDILELIRMHARVGMLKKLIENPTQFSAKDLKELVRDTQPGPDLDKPVNPLGLISGLDIPDTAKAQLVAAMTDLVKQDLRKQIGGPRGSTQR